MGDVVNAVTGAVGGVVNWAGDVAHDLVHQPGNAVADIMSGPLTGFGALEGAAEGGKNIPVVGNILGQAAGAASTPGDLLKNFGTTGQLSITPTQQKNLIALGSLVASGGGTGILENGFAESDVLGSLLSAYASGNKPVPIDSAGKPALTDFKNAVYGASGGIQQSRPLSPVTLGAIGVLVVGGALLVLRRKK